MDEQRTIGEASPSGAWTPLLTGAAADEARAAILEIADALSDPQQSRVERGERGVHARDGACRDRSLFRLSREKPAGSRSRGTRDPVPGGGRGQSRSAGASRRPLPWGLRDRLGGGALRRLAVEPESEEDDLNEASDEVVLERLAVPSWSDDYDLINGLVGLGVYALSRRPRATATESLSRIVRHLETTAEPQPRGLTWWTPPSGCGGLCARRRPRRVSTTSAWRAGGRSHPFPGGLLRGGDRAGEDPRPARGRRRVAPVTEARRGQAIFPDFVGPEISPKASMLAWCYGDVGIAGTLLRAARAVGEPRWEAEALELARRAAVCPHRSERPGLLPLPRGYRLGSSVPAALSGDR